MWASKTDYSKLYAADYFGKSDGAASYNGSDFEREFFDFCAGNGITALVDVGTGSGKLKQSATAAGMFVSSCDFQPIAQDAFHFDLSSEKIEDTRELRARIGELMGSRDYITTCLDVMEHIDIEDVGNAIFNLREIAAGFAIVSISTRPSSRGNKYHSTILPISTWQRLFELSGFEIVDARFCAEGRRIMPLESADPTLKIINHWAQADIFRDRRDGEPTYFLVRKTENTPEKQAVLPQIEHVLDIAYRRLKRTGFDTDRLQGVALNISHFQDFFNLRPLLDVIPRGQCSVLLRQGMLRDDEEQLVVGFFERCGVPVLCYRSVSEINWNILHIRALISAAESSAAITHALSAQLVEAANLHGINTILLQHGIWIEPMTDREIGFASNTIMTWGAEQQQFFSSGRHAVAGAQYGYGAIDATRFVPAGSPKFHDSLLAQNTDVLKWRLGVDASRFEEVVLLGTNLKWTAHQGDMRDVFDGIEHMVSANPDRLFIIKPHPSERHIDYSHIKASNTLVLDDVLMGCIDLPISRLLGGVSTVVTSLSTLLLDAAVLGRRCIQYDTGNRFGYKACKPFPSQDLHLAIRNQKASSLDASTFRDYYNDAGNGGFYEALATCVSKPSVAPVSAQRYTDLKSAEDAWIAFRDTQNHVVALEACNQAEREALGNAKLEIEQLTAEFDVERQQYLMRSKTLGETHKQELRNAAHEISRISAELEAERQVTVSAQASLAIMRSSASWRMTAPYRWLGHQILRIRYIARILPNLAKARGGYMKLAAAAIRVVSRRGVRGAIASLRYANGGSVIAAASTAGGSTYADWLKAYADITDDHRQQMKSDIATWPIKPVISIVMPVYNADVQWLEEAIESVTRQLYPHWELCIADDCSPRQDVRDFLKAKAATDPRLKVVFRPANGHISEASNSAIELVTGEWMALLDQDDLLSEDALYYIARTINNHPECELVYSDEDKIEDGIRRDPYFKSDWNPDLLRSQNMISHLGAYRVERVRAIGGFRKGYEGSQDHDLVLRFTENLPASAIRHIPRVLYHWRSHPDSTAQSGSNKNYASIAGQRALTDHIERLGLRGEVEILPTGMYRVRYSLPDILPKVSLIIPTKNGFELIRQCVDSIIKKTTYPNYEILIIDNNSDDARTLEYFSAVGKDERVRIIKDDRPFNYSAINNRAVELAEGEYVALVNNDIEVITPGWLDEMMGFAVQRQVGVVGARLWYPDNRLQHGGVILGIHGVAGHAHKMMPKGAHGYFGRGEIIQSLSAVTAACIVVRKEIFSEVGGLDEDNLKIAFNDVDFCLKVREAGYRNIWTPYAELYHHESASRGLEDTPEKMERFRSEVFFMMEKWKDHLPVDPAYNPNLTLVNDDFSLAWPPRNLGDPTLAS